VKDSPEIRPLELLKKQGFRFKKKWGQNFLLDKNILKRIVAGAGITAGDRVVEIGAGAGTLTRALAETGARVLALEIDHALIPVLTEYLAGLEVLIIQGDVLRLDLDELTGRHNMAWPYKVVANLPYYITTPVIMDILEKEYHFENLTLMVQWEVAQRLTAQPGTRECGAVTLAVSYYTEAKVLFKVPRSLFHPAPEVDSAVVCLQKRQHPPVEVPDKNLLFKLIKAGFGQRRKTLLNALQSVAPGLDKETVRQYLQRAGIDGNRRGETLSLKEYAALAQAWKE
jgi:16S rRNA (adenine1518-N6/adenine1519-N6)-dimethyltransferase